MANDGDMAGVPLDGPVGACGAVGVVRGIDLEVRERAFVGPSGRGKGAVPR